MKISRNTPCPCGSGKKYKKCCLAQDEKDAAEARERRDIAEEAEHAAFVAYANELDELSNRANDLIRSGQWAEAEQCCRELQERFPQQIDGPHRSYQYYKARGDFANAKIHAQATRRMVERDPEGFDPDFLTELDEEIAHFEQSIQADRPAD